MKNKLKNKTISFQYIVDKNKKLISELEVIKQQNKDMKGVLEIALNFIIPPQLRFLISKTLKSLK